MKIVNVPKQIYRGYDIRGLVDKELSEDVYYTLGKAYATFLYKRQIRETVVGRDIRLTGEMYQKAFMEGLMESGVDVIDIGLTLTQMMYFSQYQFLSKGGAIVTASHNPKEFNGLKLGVGFSDTMLGEEVQEMRTIVEGKEFADWGIRGGYRAVNIYDQYKSDLFKRVALHNSGLKVVVDSCAATTGAFLPQILREAGCEVVEQNTTPDGNFPMGTPDPTEKDVLERLAHRVVSEGADLGFAYDSDGDRMGVVDGVGNFIWNDVLAALFAVDILHFMPGSPIIFNTLCSKTTSDAIRNAGGLPIIWKTGHSYIKAKVKDARAPFGGELSGHFFFMDNFYGHDDGAFSSLRLLAYLKRTGMSLEEAVNKMPKYVSSPEIKLGLADELKFNLIDEKISLDIRELLPNAEYVSIDGFRADSPDEMVIIRASQNGPYITIKFEGRTQEQYDNLKKSVANILHKYLEIDWAQGVNIHGFE